MDRIRLINSSDIKRVITFKDLVPAVERSLLSFSKGPLAPDGAVQPLRSRINIQDHNGTVIVMPGYLPSEGALATKLITMYPNNASRGLKSHNAIVILINSENGEIEALLDGESITELRTAASSGVASKYLAPSSVKKVAVLGAGTQGASHARVHHYLFEPEEISIWSRTQSSAGKLVESLSREGIPASLASSVREASVNADIINTCTLSSSPILQAVYVQDGAHINAVGAARPDWRELDPSLMTSSIIYADSKEAAQMESGDVIQSNAEIFAEIGEVINGQKEARRSERTIYKSLGIAVLDAVTAKLVVDLLQKE